MKDLFVRRVYTHNGISIVVELDFVKKTVSLVEKDGRKKNWLFAERTPEYLCGWLNIVEAMKYAITEAKKVMDSFTEKDYLEFIEMYAQLDRALTPKESKNKW